MNDQNYEPPYRNDDRDEYQRIIEYQERLETQNRINRHMAKTRNTIILFVVIVVSMLIFIPIYNKFRSIKYYDCKISDVNYTFQQYEKIMEDAARYIDSSWSNPNYRIEDAINSIQETKSDFASVPYPECLTEGRNLHLKGMDYSIKALEDLRENNDEVLARRKLLQAERMFSEAAESFEKIIECAPDCRK